MKKKLFLFSAMCLLFSSAFQPAAQTPTGPPPKVLLIVREDIKPGKMAVHENNSMAFVRLLRKAKSPYHRLAMTPVAGNENEVMYLWPFDSFADLEKYNQDLEKWATGPLKAEFELLDRQGADLHAAQRDIVAVYREDLSYRPNINVAQMRYTEVGMVRVRPGHGADFTDLEKTAMAEHEKANLDEHWAAYEVVSGAPGGTYLFFTPMKSLKEADASEVAHRVYRQALSEETRKKLQRLASDSIFTTESSLYAFHPRMSYVSKEFATADPDFWTPKPKVAAKPAPETKKEGAKPGKESPKPGKAQ